MDDLLIKQFNKWVESITDKEKPMIAINNRSMSINDLIQEVNNKTDLGKKFLHKYAELIK